MEIVRYIQKRIADSILIQFSLSHSYIFVHKKESLRNKIGKSESRLKLSSLIASNFCLLGSYIYLLCQGKEEFIEMSGLLGIFLFLVKKVIKYHLLFTPTKRNNNKIKKLVTAKWIVPTTELLHLCSIYSNWVFDSQ